MFQNSLKHKWSKIIEQPEYKVSENSNEIKSTSDNITLVNIDSTKLAASITELMNFAFREGAKQIIKLLEEQL